MGGADLDPGVRARFPGRSPGRARWPAEQAGEGRLGGTLRRRIILAGGVSLLAWGVLQWVSPPPQLPWTEAMETAAREMARGLEVVNAHCRRAGIPLDEATDPLGTCLVGPRYSPLVTSLGSLEAKRTSLTPDLAGLLVYLLTQAGVSAGDTVAVGASGSFPGLLLATLTAIRALEAHPVTILSLGASSFGATRPDLHLLDLHELLRGEGVFGAQVAAVTLGGEGDVGPDLPLALSEELRRDAAEAGVPLLFEPGFRSNVARRMEIYGRPGAFVNVGGAEANLGLSPEILELAPGLIQPSRGSPRASEAQGDPGGFLLPPPEERGVVFEMLARGVPVIHLLHLQGLALRYGLPWDPATLPEPGSTALREGSGETGIPFWLLTVTYLGILGLLVLLRGRRASPPAPESPTPSA